MRTNVTSDGISDLRRPVHERKAAQATNPSRLLEDRSRCSSRAEHHEVAFRLGIAVAAGHSPHVRRPRDVTSPIRSSAPATSKWQEQSREASQVVRRRKHC